MRKKFLLAALEQAWLGRGMCAPNPSVGAVAVFNSKIIAQAWHLGAGHAHAEKILLDQLPDTAGVTLYSTLEPCNHWGKTPPCVDAIINRGIKRVVYAYADPNPIVARNNTPSILRNHGVEVIHQPMPEIDAFYQSYKYWTQHQRPWVTVKLAQSLDGKIAGHKGVRIALSNDACNNFTHKQRLYSDVLLTSAKTINNDNPLFNVRLGSKVVAKKVAIIDSNLSLKAHLQIFHSAKSGLVFHQPELTLPAHYHNMQSCPIPMQDGQLLLQRILQTLGERGAHDVFVEVGRTLFNALHQAKLVNRTYIYVCPQIVGSEGMDAYWNKLDDKRVSWQVLDDNAVAVIDWEV